MRHAQRKTAAMLAPATLVPVTDEPKQTRSQNSSREELNEEPRPVKTLPLATMVYVASEIFARVTDLRWRSVQAATLALVVLFSFGGPANAVGPVDYTAGPVARGEQFRLSIAAADAGTPQGADVFWPYDTTPPAGVPAGTGVSCDLLVWLPGVSTDAAPSYTRPACWEHPFNPAVSPERRTAGKPTYTYRWSGRFSPLVSGTHHARLRFTDANGTRYTDIVTFEATASTHPGPIQVSATDPRFFEYENGTTLPARAGIHINAGLPENLTTSLGLPLDAMMPAALPPGLFPLQRDFWHPSHGDKAWCGFSGAGGQKDWNHGTNLQQLGGAPVGDGGKIAIAVPYKIEQGYVNSVSPRIQDSTRETGYTNGGPEYEFRATVKVTPGFVPAQAGAGYGADVIIYPFEGDYQPVSICRTTLAQAQSGQFVEISARFRPNATVPQETRASVPILGFYNVVSGEVRWRNASLKRVLPDGTLGGELYANPEPDVRRYYDQRAADLCDRTLAYAASRGEYVKPILFDYLDSIWNQTQEDGSIGGASHGNVYGPSDPTIITPARWLQRAAIRYAIARWGWSPHIWAFEFVNEGDPYHGGHFGGAEHFARYVHEVSQRAGRRLLASTSFWHSQSNFWHDTSCDFVDVHQYPGHIGGQGLVQYNQSIEPFPLPLVKDELEPWRREVLEMEVDRFNQANMKYVPLKPGHRYQVRYAVRTINMVPDPGFQSAGPHLNLFYVTGHAGIQPSTTPWGTYEFTSHVNDNLPANLPWTERVSEPSTCPPDAHYLRIEVGIKGGATTGKARYDNIRLEDLTTGEITLLFNGDFNYSRWYRDDTALFMEACWREYAGGGGTFARVFDKPWMIGEDSPGPVESDPAATNEQFLLAYRKRLWAAALSPGQPYSMLWWAQGLVERGAWAPFQAVRSFLSPYLSGPGRLSSGEWKDARPACVATGNAGKLRAIGQINRAQGTGMIWVDNADHILGNLRDGIAVAPVSGTVSVPVPNGTYRVQRFSTSNGLAQGTSAMQKVTNGKLVLSVSGLTTDTAFTWTSL